MELQRLYPLGVGWVVACFPVGVRSETRHLLECWVTLREAASGVYVPQTPLALSRETRPTQWLPNLQFLLQQFSRVTLVVHLTCTCSHVSC
ncbi:hypothetical protein NIES25_35080 [Nostoc linckia NIES-25]|nr:hypothetical protein NIES25_35080 [Nostoc linckia NIES-25]